MELIVVIAIFFGYIFGKGTCSFHYKNKTRMALFVVFIVANIFHPIIDGIGIKTLSLGEGIVITTGHELLRQPPLYALWFTRVNSLHIKIWKKIVLGVFAITGTWILGIFLGRCIPIHIDHHHKYVVYGFLCGDFLHHVLDYIKHKKITH
jgi:hypothetical protein